VAVVVGFLLHLAVGGLVLVSGLIMPAWAVVVLAIVWAGALVVAIRWRARPALVVVVPFVMLAIWVVTAWVGDRLFDWTA